MSDDFDSLGAVHLVIGLYALRTFKVTDGQLASVIAGAGHWENGVCTAICTRNPDHQAPADDCHCGIYGTHMLEALFRQFGEFARRMVAVIAPEGPTVNGTTGLKTAAARIVAYWCDPDRPGEEVEIWATGCPNARRFYDVDLMARLYGLGR